MARPRKNGLDYFPLDVDFFEDHDIKIVKARFGNDGLILYLYLLCRIYKEGYYLSIDDDFEYVISDDLNMSFEKIGQLINFFLKRSLFDNTLFLADKVLTSLSVQRRFQLAVKSRAKKNPVKVGRFWLLKEEETAPFIKVTTNVGFSENNLGFSRNNSGFSKEKSLKESKVNTYIYYSNPELEKCFQKYIKMRQQEKSLLPEQIEDLKTELNKIAVTDEERIAICKKAFISGWKSFYPINKSSSRKDKDSNRVVKTNKSNSFHNFEQRSYDYEALENKLVNRQHEN